MGACPEEHVGEHGAQPAPAQLGFGKGRTEGKEKLVSGGCWEREEGKGEDREVQAERHPCPAHHYCSSAAALPRVRGEDVDGPGISLFAAGGKTRSYPCLHAVPFALGGKCTAEMYREENTERNVKI